MKKFWLVLPIFAVSSLSVFSQAPTPAPTPTPQVDKDVVKISTNLVQVDITVTDKDGRIVRDLKNGEIEIYQNDKKQDISNVTFVSTSREMTETAAGQSKTEVQVPPAPIAGGPVRRESVRRSIALVVDDLNLSYESVNSAKKGLKKFVDEQMTSGDLVAIIQTGSSIGALQQFTADRRQLYAAIDKIQYNGTGTGDEGAFAPVVNRRAIPIPMNVDTPFETESENRATFFGTATLSALGFVINGMTELPGRKSMVLLSDGFAAPRDDKAVLRALQDVIDKANRASVVIYTMDARGLAVTGLSAADDLQNRSEGGLRAVEGVRIRKVNATQEGLRYIAQGTGGGEMINNNDLSVGIRKVLDDQSYYLVGFIPDEDTFDPKRKNFNALTVKVTRPDTTVRYRSGFFGVTDEQTKTVARQTTVTKLEKALTSPFAVNEIPLHINTLFGVNEKDGPHIWTLLHIGAQDLTFTDMPDGSKKANLDMMAVAFGDNGMAVEHASAGFTVVVKKEDYASVLKNGFVKDFRFSMKKPGAYQLRVAVRDRSSEKVGSAGQFVEVPDLKGNRLTLSGVALENISFAAWQERSKGTAKKTSEKGATGPMADTAMRQFKRGSVLNYGFSVYNARTQDGVSPGLTLRIKIFCDGKPMYTGKTVPITPLGDADPRAPSYTASLSLGTDMVVGDYVLQIDVTDNSSKDKPKIATQYVQFAIVD